MNDRRPTYEELEAKVEALEEQVRRLTELLEKTTRAGKRQAAPFAKGEPKPNPKRPGRKSGKDHGTHYRREPVPDAELDEIIDVPLPASCPHCQSDRMTEFETPATQYQVEIPQQVIHRRIDIRLGCCEDCGRAVRGRHELQTSNATGAAGVMFGPNLQAAIAILNKEVGLTHGKIQRAFKILFGLTIGRASSCRSLLRTAQKAAPAMDEIRQEVRGSPVVKLDETGWRVNGQSRWLHVLIGPRAVLYEIDGRGRDVAKRIIGSDYPETMIHDGYSAYDGFVEARHQQCVFHLLKRCRGLLEKATRGAVRFPRAVESLLRTGLSLRDRYQSEEVTSHGLKVMAGRPTNQLRDLALPIKSNADNERFALFLWKHATEVFEFLRQPDAVSATNNEAEFELRFNVIARKLSGGNRNDSVRQAQQTLPSIIRTCRKNEIDPFTWLYQLLTSPTNSKHTKAHHTVNWYDFLIHVKYCTISL
tara:strand:- start:11187 stop:12614 length:1428 start_codon:yes stop_codon:yes gene_type:complete